jgi:hypothetical protein
MTLGESPAAGGQEGVETNTMTKSRSLLLIAALAPVTLMLQSTYVCAQPATAEVPAVRRASPPSEKEKINAWSVGLAGGLLEGPPIRLAAEMARVVDDGPNLHVLPIVTRGPTENVNSLLPTRSKSTSFRHRGSAAASATAQSVSVGAAHLRPTGNHEPAGSRGQESKFQHPRHGRRLFRAADLQPPRHQRRKDLHSPPGRA